MSCGRNSAFFSPYDKNIGRMKIETTYKLEKEICILLLTLLIVLLLLPCYMVHHFFACHIHRTPGRQRKRKRTYTKEKEHTHITASHSFSLLYTELELKFSFFQQFYGSSSVGLLIFILWVPYNGN